VGWDFVLDFVPVPDKPKEKDPEPSVREAAARASSTRVALSLVRILSYGTDTLQIGSFSLVINFFTTSSSWAGRSERQLTQVS
jgi:hypothetical protein